jgi:acyl-coenzyme A thioesterase PaaI-like protein
MTSYTCIYDGDTSTYYAVYSLGPNVCGNPKVLHGGMTAAMLDETAGGLLQSLKIEGQLKDLPTYTVHLGIQYLAMAPASQVMVGSATLKSVEGRKIWVDIAMSDRHGPKKGTTYATAKALFVYPRKSSVVGNVIGQTVRGAMSAIGL